MLQFSDYAKHHGKGKAGKIGGSEFDITKMGKQTIKKCKLGSGGGGLFW